MKIIIAGIGSVGRQTLESLSERKSTQLVAVDIDQNRCDEASASVDALVLHGDATDPAILEKAGVREADALVATTGSDAINTVIAMLGHRAGLERIIVKLTGYGLRPACLEIGVTAIVAPTIAAAAQIEGALFGSERIDLSVLSRGGLILIEAEVEAPVNVADLDALQGTRIIAVRHEREILLPERVRTLRGAEVVFALVEGEERAAALRKAVGRGEAG